MRGVFFDKIRWLKQSRYYVKKTGSAIFKPLRRITLPIWHGLRQFGSLLHRILKRISNFILRTLNRILEYARKDRGNLFLISIIFYFVFGGAFLSLCIKTYSDIRALLHAADWLKILGIVADLASLASITGTILFAFMRFRSQNKKATKFQQALRREIRQNSPTLERIGVDALKSDALAFLERKMTPIYIDLFDRLEDIDSFAYDFYVKLSGFISKFYKHDRLFSRFLFFVLLNENQSAAPHFRREYAKIDFSDPKSVDALALLLYDHYVTTKTSEKLEFNPQYLNTIGSADKNTVSKIREKIFDPENTRLFEVLQEKSLLEISDSLLTHLIEKSYALLSDSTDTPMNLQPLILIKNSEDFRYYWKPLNEQIRVRMRAAGNFTPEQIKNYNIPNDGKLKISSPFFDALRADPHFSQLPNNKQSPVFMVFPEELPRPHKYKVVEYIENVIAGEAKKFWREQLKNILKVYPYLVKVEKELVLDFELFPFDPNKIDIHSRDDRLPDAFKQLMVSRVLKGQKKNEFIKVNLLEINALLKQVGPFALITKSIPKNSISELKTIELKFINSLASKANGSIQFEGVDKIAGQKNNTGKIAKTLHLLATKHLKALKLTAKECSSVITEIIRNAELLDTKLSKKSTAP